MQCNKDYSLFSWFTIKLCKLSLKTTKLFIESLQNRWKQGHSSLIEVMICGRCHSLCFEIQSKQKLGPGAIQIYRQCYLEMGAEWNSNLGLFLNILFHQPFYASLMDQLCVMDEWRESLITTIYTSLHKLMPAPQPTWPSWERWEEDLRGWWQLEIEHCLDTLILAISILYTINMTMTFELLYLHTSHSKVAVTKLSFHINCYLYTPNTFTEVVHTCTHVYVITHIRIEAETYI